MIVGKLSESRFAINRHVLMNYDQSLEAGNGHKWDNNWPIVSFVRLVRFVVPLPRAAPHERHRRDRKLGRLSIRETRPRITRITRIRDYWKDHRIYSVVLSSLSSFVRFVRFVVRLPPGLSPNRLVHTLHGSYKLEFTGTIVEYCDPRAETPGRPLLCTNAYRIFFGASNCAAACGTICPGVVSWLAAVVHSCPLR